MPLAAGVLLLAAAVTLGLRELGADLSFIERLAALGAWSKAKQVFTGSPLVVSLLIAAAACLTLALVTRLRSRRR